MTDDRLALSAAISSVVVAVVLIALKSWALTETGSISVAASLADSALDLAASSTGLAALIYAMRPADSDHRYGHASAEDLAALAQSILVLSAAALILFKAFERTTNAAPLESEASGIVVMAVSIALSVALVAWQTHVATRTGSPVVAADRMHYLADLLPNLGAIVALGAAAYFDIQWLDVVIAVAAALVLAIGGLRIFKRSFDALMDREAESGLGPEIERIAATLPGIVEVHDVRSRRTGRRMFIQLHARLDGEMSLRDAHDLGERLRLAVVARFPEAEVLVHEDPV